MVSAGDLLCRAGKADKGIVLFALVEHHSAANQETKDRAAQLLDGYKLQLRANDLTAATQLGQTAALDETVHTLLAELPTLDLSSPPTEAGDPLPEPNQALIEPLTARELEVLQLLAEGLSNQEIARRLTLAEGTVNYYTRQIYGKLQVRNRVRAVDLARELGLV